VKTRTTTVLAVTLAASTLCALTACTDSSQAGDKQGTGKETVAIPAASEGDALYLADVCPATLVFQQDWEPEAEHSGMYGLVGPDYTVDTDLKRVSGSLVASGVDTGVDIEVRPGGSAVSYQSVASLMYSDKDITFGAVNTDSAIAASKDQPVTAVIAQLNVSPQIIMWTKDSYPGATTIKEVAAAGANVVVSGGGSNLGAILSGSGTVPADQVDQSYNGDPSRFVGDTTIAQQGFVSAEPYVYENEVSAFSGKEVGWQLASEVGYTIYPEPISVRTGDLEELSPCLEKIVPILQQVQIDYLQDPSATNDLILDLVTQYNNGWVYTKGTAEYAAEALKEHGIVKTDSSGIFGGLDQARIGELMERIVPILEADGATIKPGLTAQDLFTNEFLDPEITFAD
jgi:hypothetical protein